MHDAGLASVSDNLVLKHFSWTCRCSHDDVNTSYVQLGGWWEGADSIAGMCSTCVYQDQLNVCIV